MIKQDFTHRRIFKYEIPVESRFVIMMPKGAQVLSVGRQGPLPYLWASVDPAQSFEPRVFRLVTTGEVFNEERLWYIGHVQLGGEVRNGITEGWFEAFVFEVETSIEQINPDPIEGRFAEDMAQVRKEIVETEEKEAIAA
jgi:hypothetical protein